MGLSEYTKKYLKVIDEDGDNTYGEIGSAGEGLLFMYLASKHLSENGKMAFILPKSLLSGVSWFMMRAYLLERFHIEYVVVSYDKRDQKDGGGYNFSESTHLSEVLIVAQKKKESDMPTKFISLLKKPQTSFEAKELSKLITKNQISTEFESSSAVIQIVTKDDLTKNLDTWGRFVAFPSQQLNDYVHHSTEGIVEGHKFKITRLSTIAEIGVDRHQFWNYFKESNSPGSYSAVIGGEEENRSRLVVTPNSKIIAKDKKGRETFKWLASNLLVPDRIRVNTAHYLGLYSTEPVMSNLFYSVKWRKKGNEEAKYKALCLWLNSVWGMLTILSIREDTEGGFVGLKLTHWRALPVLDVSALNVKTLNQFVKLFDEQSKNKLSRLTEQFDSSNPDSARKTLDVEVAKTLGMKITETEIDELYRIIHEAFSAWM